MNNSLMSRRLTHRELAATLDITPGDLTKIRAKGSRQYDPTFPLPVGGFFIENEALAWQKLKKEAADQQLIPPPSASTPKYDRRSSVADRRRQS